MHPQSKSQPENSLVHSDEGAFAAHVALINDAETWQRLQFLGLFMGTSALELTEMRLCPKCGSSIHRAVSPAAGAALLSRLADIQARSIEQLARAMR